MNDAFLLGPLGLPPSNPTPPPAWPAVAVGDRVLLLGSGPHRGAVSTAVASGPLPHTFAIELPHMDSRLWMAANELLTLNPARHPVRLDWTSIVRAACAQGDADE